MGRSTSQLQGGQSPVVQGLALNYDPTANGLPPFVGDQLFRPLTVNAVKGTVEIDNDAFLEETADDRSYKGSNIIDPEGMTSFTYVTSPKGLKIPVIDRDLKARATVETPEAYRNRMVSRMVHNFLLQREIRQATKATTAANYVSGMSETISAGSEFDTDNSDIRGVFENAEGALDDRMKPATHVLIPKRVMNAIAKDSDMLEYLRVKNGRFSAMDIEDSYSMKVIIAADYYKNSAGSLVNVWGDNMIFFHMPVEWGPSDPGGPCFGRTVEFQSLESRRYMLNDPKGWMEVIESEYDLIFAAVDNSTNKDSIGGYLVRNCLA